MSNGRSTARLPSQPSGRNSSGAPASDSAGPTSSPERTVLSTDRQAGSGAPASDSAGPTSSPERTVHSTDRQAGSGAAQHVVIVGMMGSGKTTLGLALAEHFSLPYFDSDQTLIEKMGESGRDLADRRGVEFLHSCEAEILLDQLSSTSPSVISAAASTIDDATCRDHLARGHRVCWLDAPAGLLTQRLQAIASTKALAEESREPNAHNRTDADEAPQDGSHRRKLRSAEFEALFIRRRALFAKSASVHLDATLPVEQLLARIVDASVSGTCEVPDPLDLFEETSHV
jgi:shikimate kinase